MINNLYRQAAPSTLILALILAKVKEKYALWAHFLF